MVDGIRVLGIWLTNREITEQLGGDRCIGYNLIEIRVQLMNLLLHRKLGLQRRVWPVTLWRKKGLPQKENFFDFVWFILVCGEQGHWWVAVFLHLLSSPEVWILDSLCPDCAQRQQRGTVLWDLRRGHWKVHNQHQPWPFSTDVTLRKFHCVHQPDCWSCAVFACSGAELVVSLVSLGARLDINVKVEYPKRKRIVFLPSAILAHFWFLLVFENLLFFTLSTGDRFRTL